MVSCQELSYLKESKHSLQRHPHDAALVNAHSFVSMGVEARCRPCHSAAHCRPMKRQTSLRYCHPLCGCCHCDCRRCRRRHCWLHCCCRRRLPSPLPSLFAIAVAVAIDHHRRCLCRVALSHCVAVALAISDCHLRHRPPLQLPSPLAITIAIAVSHFWELLPWRSMNWIWTI